MMSVSYDSRFDCIVVGAGLSGLLAATILQDRGKRVLVLDKCPDVGGRLATRQIGAGIFDYGAQFFTVRDSLFGRLVEQWQAKGIVKEWCRGFADADGI